MINIIGMKRLIILAVLAAMNVFIAMALYLYFQPKHNDVNTDLNATIALISSNRVSIARLDDGFNTLKEKQAMYDNLVDIGFFSDQDRFRAPERLEKMRVVSDLIRTRYKFGAAKSISNTALARAGHILLSTPVRVDGIEAMDDIDIFKFIYWIENAFTGQTSITSINFERTHELDDSTLNAIGHGRDSVLIEGSINFDWRTIIPKENFDSGDMGPISGTASR